MDAMQELQLILKDLIVPEGRKNDLGWLNRNLLINNQNDKGRRAHSLVRQLQRKTALQKCIRCSKSESVRWWKCCPKHTTEQGLDVMCEECAKELHPEEFNGRDRTNGASAGCDRQFEFREDLMGWGRNR